MIRNQRTILGAVVGGALATLSLALAPVAAHAEMTEPPACVESPYGGCQNGPLGNGIGGSGTPTGTIDVLGEFYDINAGHVQYEGEREFRRVDGRAPTWNDAERMNWALPGLSPCVPVGLSLICND